MTDWYEGRPMREDGKTYDWCPMVDPEDRDNLIGHPDFETSSGYEEWDRIDRDDQAA